MYAVQEPSGAWHPIRKPVTTDVLQAHLDGTVAVGTYLLIDGRCRHAVVDVDTGNFDDVRRIARFGIGRLDAAPFVTTSGRKGWHLWWFFPTEVQAADVRYTLAEVVSPGIELFPKQDRAKNLGNLIRLPGGVHPVTGARTEVVGHGKIEPADPGLLWTPGHISMRPYAGAVKRMLTAPVQPGERNNTLFGWATWCAWHLGLPEDLAVLWAKRLMEDWPDPLSESEIVRTIESAYANEPPERNPHA